MAVTVREFHPLPYYPEPSLRHLKEMERTCKLACKLTRSPRPVNLGNYLFLRLEIRHLREISSMVLLLCVFLGRVLVYIVLK